MDTLKDDYENELRLKDSTITLLETKLIEYNIDKGTTDPKIYNLKDDNRLLLSKNKEILLKYDSLKEEHDRQIHKVKNVELTIQDYESKLQD